MEIGGDDPTLHWSFTSEGSAISKSGHNAHGLEGTLEEADWPALTLEEADRLLRRYPQAGGAERILTVSPRPFSAASVVETPNGKVFVKRHSRRVRDREGLLEEHRLMAYLAERCERLGWAGLVQPAMAERDGVTAVEAGEWSYEVHPLALGLDLYEDALSWTPFRGVGHARAAGRALARLHRAAEGYEGPARGARQLVSSFRIFAEGELSADRSGAKLTGSPMERMDNYLRQRPMLRMYAELRDWREAFDELFLPFYEKLEPWLAYLEPLWTHNDFHASNLIWSGDGDEAEVIGIIDFGLADRTNAVHDLATAIERNIVEWLRIAGTDGGPAQGGMVNLDHLDALLAGYEELHPLSYEVARGLVAMLPLVHCEFALSETDYFLSILNSEGKAYLAYEGYFLAHAQWFKSMEGQRLLRHMEQWAETKAARGIRR